MIGLIVVTIFTIMGVVYFSRTMLANSQTKLVNAKLENYTFEKTEEIYRKNQKLLNENKDIANIISNIVPAEKDQAKAVRELNAIAENNNLVVSSITFPRSDLLNKAKTTTTATTSQQSDQKEEPQKAISQAKPIKGLKGVYSIELSAEISSANNDRIPTDKLLSFLENIENNRRNMRITSINISSSGDNINLKLLIFIKP